MDKTEITPLLKRALQMSANKIDNDKVFNLKNNCKIIFVNSKHLYDNEKGIFHPDKRLFRFSILLLSCLVGFGACICYDSPAPLQEHIRKEIKLTASQFMALYSWYSWPNIILCFFGGYLIDKVFGIRSSIIIFSALILLGNIIFAIGAYLKYYWLMCIGRFVFGIGGESLAVAQNFFAILWFKGKEINLVFGLQLSVSRLGSTVSFNALVPLYTKLHNYLKNENSLGITFFIITISCVFSFLAALSLVYLDWKAERIRKTPPPNDNDTPSTSCLIGSNQFNTSNNTDTSTTTSNKKSQEVSLKDITKFPVSVWLINVVCVTYYIALFTFIGLGIPFFQNKFKLTLTQASIVNSIVYIMSAVLSPIFGFVVDRVGYNLSWITASFLLAILSHATMSFSMSIVSPYACMVVLGISYSILSSALWPLVSYEVPSYQLGTAYGLMQALMNGGLAAFSQVAGAIVDYKGYLYLEIFFMTLLFVGLLANSIMHMRDRLKSGLLDVSPKTREIRMKAFEENVNSETDSSGKNFPCSNVPEGEEAADNSPLFPSYFSCNYDDESAPIPGYNEAVNTQPIFPRSAFYIRNRYLSKIGFKVPRHVLVNYRQALFYDSKA